MRLERGGRHRRWVIVGLLTPAALALASAACGETEISPPSDGGVRADGPSADVAEDAPVFDASDAAPPPKRETCSDVTGQPSRLLVGVGLSAHGRTELASFDLVTRTVTGSFSFPDDLGLVSTGTDPYALGRRNGIVYRMKGAEPWTVVGSWNASADDDDSGVDAGAGRPELAAVVVPDCKKGYVLRRQRNKILVIDTNATADAVAPASDIDLSTLRQPDDLDGRVEPVAGAWVPSKKLIYVLLANVDHTKETIGASQRCATTKPSLVAIDPATDALVSLGGAGPGGGIMLEGYAPATQLVLDEAGDRLLVLSGGCRTASPNPLQRALVEEVKLATNAVRTLLDSPLPLRSWVYIDATRAAIQVEQRVHAWNPQESVLGGRLPGWFDAIAHDGKGNIVGPYYDFADASPPRVDIVSSPLTSAGMPDGPGTKIGKIDYPGGYVSLSGEVWP